VITPQFNLDLHREIFIDNFAGGGGASTGIERGLGRFVDSALNHDREALAMHRMNHPQTRHYCEDIRTADPLKIAAGRPVGGIWFSPDCKHFSKAKGGKPRSKKIRGLAWVVIHWINKVSPRMIFLENVEEFQTWCPLDKGGRPSKWRKGWFFECFVGALRRRGYTVDHREIRACNAGAPTIRKRFYLMARRDGQPIVWPEASHGPTAKKPHRIIAECLDFSLPCPSIFLSRIEARAVKAVRPLADATMARVAKGVDRYVLKSKRPFLVSLTHQGGDRVESVDEPIRTVTGAHRGEKALVAPVIAYAQHGGATRPADAPMHTVAASPKDQNQLLAVHLTKFNTGAVGQAVDEPGPTVTANSFIKRPGGAAPMGVVAASVVKMRGTNVGHPLDEPGHTISAQGTHHAVSAIYIAQHNGGANGHQTIGHPADKPASTINSKGSQQQVVAASLIKYYGTDQDPRIEEPCHVVTTRDRFALVEAMGIIPPLTPELKDGARRVADFLRAHGVQLEGEYAMVGEYVIVDIGMRMLKPRELYRAQGFPENYIIDRGLDELPDGRLVEIPLTGTAQVRMCGNSVCPPVAEALVSANLPDMRVHEFAA
jgi:DNA (cytosine-5)-methyltransferase 1